MQNEEFEEVIEPIAATIETMEYLYLKTDKSGVSTYLKTLSSQFPIPEDVIIDFGNHL